MKILLSRLLFAFVAVAAYAQTVARYDVYERTITFPSGGYSNPWEQVTATMTVTSPTSVVKTVGGFYHSTDTWKARFAPDEIGTYTYQTSISDGGTPQTSSGSFTVVASTWPGFVRQSAQNRVRFVTDDGAPFHPIGLGDCLSVGLNDMSMDSNPNGVVNGATYFAAFGSAKFNVFRWSVDNCAYKLWNTIAETGNSYLVAEGQAGDNLVQLLRQNNIRAYMAIFGFSPPFGTAPTTSQLNAIKRYVKYVVDRYGAYVDFWELMNEATVDSTWYDQVALYLRSVDPYQHPISTSWEKPAEPRIEIVSPHWYQTEPLTEIDLYPAWKSRDFKAAGGGTKPVIFGEQGNATCNWDSTSAMRMRIRSWTAFFNEGSLIFWHTGYTKSFCNNPANLYLGPEERGYITILQNFTSGFPANATMTGVMNGSSGTLPVSDLNRVRAYGLTSATAYAAFVHAYTDHTNPTTGITITVAPQAAGTATWYAPATGAVISTQSVNAGSQTLSVPAFTSDIALKISSAPTCTYSISPTSATSPAGGNSGTVTVTANCSWTSTSNAAWLTITSGSSGTGNGSVGYTAAANSGSARTGTLTIAGQTFTVSQAAAVVSPAVRLDWDASNSPNVTGYNIYRGTTQGGPYSLLTNVSGLTYLDSAVTAGSTYYYVGKAVNSSNQESTVGSSEAQATIPGGAPPLTISCPSTTGTVGTAYSSSFTSTGGTPPVTFSLASGTLPAGLTLNASTGAVTGTPTTAGTSNFTGQATDSLSVTATAVCSITIASPPPGAFANSAPANGATDVSTTPTLSWSASSNATSYDVYFGTANPPPLATNVTVTSWAPSPLTVGTTYYWTVVAKNSAGTASSATWSFSTVPAAPGSFANLAPSNGVTGVSITPSLSWSAASGATSYDVYFGTPSTPPLVTNVTTTSWTSGTLPAGTVYFWRIVAKNSGGSTSSATWSFTTSNAPGAFSQISPTNGATGVQTSPTLTWSAASGATSYDMYLGSAPNPGLNGNTTGTSWFAGGLGNGTYYWRVVAKNAAGSTSTAEWSFTIGSAPINFTVAVNPSSLSMAPKKSANVVATATLTLGTATTATFSASGLPSGVTAKWSPTSCTLTCASTLTLTTAAHPAVGTATVTVTVVAGGVTRTANITLTTTAASVRPRHRLIFNAFRN